MFGNESIPYQHAQLCEANREDDWFSAISLASYSSISHVILLVIFFSQVEVEQGLMSQ